MFHDFICEKIGNSKEKFHLFLDEIQEINGWEKLYLQVCYLLNEESTIKREFGSLLEIKDNYPKLVLYKDSTFTGNYDGVPAVRVKDWLLGR